MGQPPDIYSDQHLMAAEPTPLAPRSCAVVAEENRVTSEPLG
jgi:hypothetical protein